MDNITEEEQTQIDLEATQAQAHLEKTGVLDATMIAEIKKQVTAEIVEELKENKVLEEKEKQIRQEAEDLERANYVARMKESAEPWVDFVGNVRDEDDGQRLEMEWNDAFIDYLKFHGIQGADDEQIVQKYIALLLRDMTDQFEDRYGNDSEYQ